ncbi:GNAT family N-acetyltransferase [Paenibacillus silvisoli]|uniref:GNAT family N-acetyltransferase n=1 Tax=Paenibacillus silvisoli TaxID=3110539 RepID=UPI00280455C2|nr:GNAT family N-acetyltransferase [Paenibacillus silvisoli]
MPPIQIIEAEQNWQRFIAIYNRCSVFAPYTIPLSEHLVQLRIVPYTHANESIALIGSHEGREGIIHAGICMIGDTKIGHIFMLFSESNDVASRLLTQVEDWFKQRGITRIYAFWWPDNPYNFILHGRETYGWAGAFPATNAFRRGNYDLLNDIVVMQLRMKEEPTVILPELDGLEMKMKPMDDNELAWSARVEAHLNGKKVGHCEMFYLKAISEHFNTKIGQITIDTDSNVHGSGIAKGLLTYAHHELYRQGARSVMLATGQALFRAIKFYQKLGYEAELIRAYSYVKPLPGGENDEL